MRWRHVVLGALLACGGAASPVAAQVRLLVAGLGGGSFDINNDGPGGSGGGFAYAGNLGVALRNLSFGAEYGRLRLGNDRKTTIYGAFVRISTFGAGAVRPYLVSGLASYRFSPSGSRKSTLGGSVGPGARFRLVGGRVDLDLEARFHTTFDHISGINSQEFVSVLSGLEFRF